MLKKERKPPTTALPPNSRIREDTDQDEIDNRDVSYLILVLSKNSDGEKPLGLFYLGDERLSGMMETLIERSMLRDETIIQFPGFQLWGVDVERLPLETLLRMSRSPEAEVDSVVEFVEKHPDGSVWVLFNG